MQTIGFAFFLIGRESQVTFLNQPQTKHSNKKANTKLPWLQVVNCSYSPFLCAFSSLLQFNCIVVFFFKILLKETGSQGVIASLLSLVTSNTNSAPVFWDIKV